MMARFYGYIDKVFEFRRLAALLTDSRLEPVIPTAAIFRRFSQAVYSSKEHSPFAGRKGMNARYCCNLANVI